MKHKFLHKLSEELSKCMYYSGSERATRGNIAKKTQMSTILMVLAESPVFYTKASVFSVALYFFSSFS